MCDGGRQAAVLSEWHADADAAADRPCSSAGGLGAMPVHSGKEKDPHIWHHKGKMVWLGVKWDLWMN